MAVPEVVAVRVEDTLFVAPEDAAVYNATHPLSLRDEASARLVLDVTLNLVRLGGPKYPKSKSVSSIFSPVYSFSSPCDANLGQSFNCKHSFTIFLLDESNLFKTIEIFSISGGPNKKIHGFN